MTNNKNAVGGTVWQAFNDAGELRYLVARWDAENGVYVRPITQTERRLLRLAGYDRSGSFAELAGEGLTNVEYARQLSRSWFQESSVECARENLGEGYHRVSQCHWR